MAVKNTKEIQVVVNAKDNASKELDKFNKKLDKLTPSFKQVAIAATAAFAAISAGIIKTTKDAAQFSSLSMSFDRLTKDFNINGDELISKLNEVSANTVSNTDLILSANRAMSLGVGKDMETMAKLMEIARLKGRAMGLSTTQAFNDIVTGIGRGSPLILDNLGIMIKVGEATENYAKQLNKGVEELTDSERSQALLTAVLKSGNEELAKAGDLQLTHNERMQQVKKSLADLSVRIGEMFLPMLEKLTTVLSNVINTVDKFITSIKEAGSIINYFKGESGGMLAFIEEKTGIITLFKEAFDSVSQSFKENLLPELRKLWEALQPLMPFLKEFAKVMGVMLYGAIIAIVKILEVSLIVLIQFLTKAVSAANIAVEAMVNAWDRFTTVLANVIIKIENTINAIKRLKAATGEKISGIGEAFKNLPANVAQTFTGVRANGGPVTAGGSYLVGENGPEIFTPSRSGSIMANGGGGTTINITGNTLLDDNAGERLGNQILEKLKLNLRV